MLHSVHLHECLEFMCRELGSVVGYNLLQKTMRGKQPRQNMNGFACCSRSHWYNFQPLRMAVNNDQVVHTVIFCRVNVDSLPYSCGSWVQWYHSWLILH